MLPTTVCDGVDGGWYCCRLLLFIWFLFFFLLLPWEIAASLHQIAFVFFLHHGVSYFNYASCGEFSIKVVLLTNFSHSV